MKRRPRPLVVTTALPSLAALLGAGLLQGCKGGASVRTMNPPEPREPPRPQVADAGVVRLPPTPIDPEHLPMAPAGAIAPVGLSPAPPSPPMLEGLPGAPRAQAPSAAMPGAPVPSAAAAAANAEAAQAAWGAAQPSGAVGHAPTARPMLVHNHPPGTPCTPIARADLERAVLGTRQ